MSTSAPGADRIPAALQHSPPAPLPSASSHRLRLTRPLEINLRRAPDPPKTSPRRTHTRAPYRRLTAPPWHKKKQVTAPIVHSSPTGLDQLTASRLILADPCLTRALSARLAETSPITVRRCAMGRPPWSRAVNASSRISRTVSSRRWRASPMRSLATSAGRLMAPCKLRPT